MTMQARVALPTFSSWDGKSFGGISIGMSEDALGHRFMKSKTVGPEPASVRVGLDKKEWILTALLSGTNNKGHVVGFELEMEKDAPIESMELLQQELGAPDYAAYPAIRYSDWSLAVWANKGIAAVVNANSRPLVTKVLMVPADVLAKNLDLWVRDPNQLTPTPKVAVNGFDILIKTDPYNRDITDSIERHLRRKGRDVMMSTGSAGWYPTNETGTRVNMSFSIKLDRNPSISGSASIALPTGNGSTTLSESSSDSFDRDQDPRERASRMFDDLLAKLTRQIDAKITRANWQTEWRQVTSLSRTR